MEISSFSEDESGVITAEVNNTSYYFYVEDIERLVSSRVNCGKYLKNDVLYSLEYCFEILYIHSSLNCTYKGKAISSSDGFPNYSGKEYYLGVVDNHYILSNSSVVVTQECDDCEKCSLSTGYSNTYQFWILLGIIIAFVILLISVFFGTKILIHYIMHKKSE